SEGERGFSSGLVFSSCSIKASPVFICASFAKSSGVLAAQVNAKLKTRREKANLIRDLMINAFVCNRQEKIEPQRRKGKIMTRRFLLVLLLVCFGVSAESPAKLVIAKKVDHLDKLAREPMIVQHPDGSLFVTGYSNEDTVPKIWKSKDEG